jgi:hypothetical protein
MSNLLSVQQRILKIDHECNILQAEKCKLLKTMDECIFIDDQISLPLVQEWITRIDSLIPNINNTEGFSVQFTYIPKAFHPFIDIKWKSIIVCLKNQIEPSKEEYKAIQCLGVKIQFNWKLDDKKRKIGMTSTEYANKRRQMIFNGVITDANTIE